MKVLCFDSETSGLDKINEYIIQLAWVTYDTITKQTTETNFILKIPKKITNSHIHRITSEISDRGYNFNEIIDIFLEDVRECDLLIGHNLKFDLEMLEVELSRLNREDDIDMLYEKPYYDTMLKSVNVCKILGKNGRNKWPKLTELYKHLFNEEFDGAHDAINDVKATLECYKKLVST